jgi:hypothetical protein
VPISLNINAALRPLRIVALAAAVLAVGVSAATPGTILPAAWELSRDGQTAMQSGVPIVILFSLPGCSYCETVRRNYLLPLSREGSGSQRPLVREADLSSVTPLRGFGNEASSGKTLAANYKIRVAPTVIVVDGRGALLAPLLEGGDVSGMYGAYLDNLLATARSALANTPAEPTKRIRQ